LREPESYQLRLLDASGVAVMAVELVSVFFGILLLSYVSAMVSEKSVLTGRLWARSLAVWKNWSLGVRM
jgi:hypothetical protein